MKAPTRSLIVALLVVTATARVWAEDPLAQVRELYGAARYEDALAAVSAVGGKALLPRSDSRTLEHYRALSLIALGRGGEAGEAFEAMVRADPMYQLSETDASPRVQSMFRDVRRRVLPEVAVQEYTAAKAIYDRKDYAAAVPSFEAVVSLLGEADLQGRLADLRLLAQGFLDLSVAAVTVVDREKEQVAARAQEKQEQATQARQDALSRTYTPSDRQVKPPVPVAQAVPPLPSDIRTQARRGVIEVTINTSGQVEHATLRERIHPAYDPLMLNAVTRWRYTPATLDGVPVRYKKLIAIAPR